MSSDSDAPAANPLTYAAPAQPTDVQVHRDGEGVTIECGPMSTAALIATLAPRALHLGLIIGVVGWFFYTSQRRVEWFFWMLMGFSVVASITAIVRVARYRMLPRMVGATPEVLFYRDARTAGRVVELPRRDLSAIGVRRRGWVYQIVAVPKKKFFTLKSQPTEPIVLLAGLDRAVLDGITTALRDVPERASPS